MKGEQRIGLLGGTFDPVHKGHLTLAAKVREAFTLDSIWFIPAAIPPHKKIHRSGQTISSFEDRAAMLERALSGLSGFSISRIEHERPQPSYTIDTLSQLRQRLGEQTKLFFIIGADAFAEISTWKNYTKLLLSADFVVISRPSSQIREVEEVINKCFRKYRHHAKECVWRPKECVWLPEDGKGGRIYFLEMEPVAISSTQIRKMVHDRYPIQDLVPPGVEEYILEHGLYGDIP